METESKLVGDREAPASSKRKPLIIGCSLLIFSLVCFVTIPVLFIFTMSMGMATGSSPAPDADPLYTSTAVIGMITLGLSLVTAPLAGLGGLVFLIIWFLNRNTYRSQPGAT